MIKYHLLKQQKILIIMILSNLINYMIIDHAKLEVKNIQKI